MLQRLREFLGLLDEDISHVPDYSDVLDPLGLTAEDDIEDIRDAVQDEIDALEAEGGNQAGQ